MRGWEQVLQRCRQGPLTPPRRVTRTLEEWRRRLTPEQFRVTRMAGTEPPFSSPVCTLFEPGRYRCVGCGSELFDAGAKFDSGSGWPSFTQPLDEALVAYVLDESHGMVRIEVRCNVCDAHLGHVFPDGPPPTGLRYCINAVALERVAD
ncbi:MAG: peptide-methionine (R)-S-oxide reductase [Lysobacteraceae bacterium]|nr:MAG: peptide-methionine (R)-S-oxide reductase [Xanthomonadaceae bacterium]